MSMTLILWKAPVVEDADEADALLQPWYETEDDSAFEPSDDIAKVADELRRRWPYWPISGEELVGSMSEEERSRYTDEGLAQLRESGSLRRAEGSPWADLPFWQSERLLSVDIAWSADDEVVAAIYALARVHELVLYDPQGPDVFLPTDPIVEEEEFPGFGLKDWLMIGAMVSALTGVTYAVWLIPHWLKWPIVVVAGFFALAAWFVLGCMIFGRQIMASDAASRDPCAKETPPL